jgi:hypothetical protein
VLELELEGEKMRKLVFLLTLLTIGCATHPHKGPGSGTIRVLSNDTTFSAFEFKLFGNAGVADSVLVLWGSGKGTITYAVLEYSPEDTFLVTVFARGSTDRDSAEIMDISVGTLENHIDGVEVGLEFQPFTFGPLFSAGQDLIISFPNDYWVPDSIDRNLYIQGVQFSFESIVEPPILLRADTAEVVWKPNLELDLSHYRVYWGVRTGMYDTNATTIDTSMVVKMLPDTTYFFAVTALDSANNESRFSNEVAARWVTRRGECDTDGNGIVDDLDWFLASWFLNSSMTAVRKEGSTVLETNFRWYMDHFGQEDWNDSTKADIIPWGNYANRCR